MRIVKEHDERRAEILDTTERLFQEKGYQATTVNDILRAVGIAKGTLYYYFQSKEDVLNAIVERYGEIVIGRMTAVMKSAALSPQEKLLRVFQAMRIKDQASAEVLEELHRAENTLLHQKIIKQMLDAMPPVLVEIIDEGNKNEVWNCRYPLRYMQIFLVAALTLTDQGMFEFDAQAQQELMIALIALLEKMLEVPEGLFTQAYGNE